MQSQKTPTARTFALTAHAHRVTHRLLRGVSGISVRVCRSVRQFAPSAVVLFAPFVGYRIRVGLPFQDRTFIYIFTRSDSPLYASGRPPPILLIPNFRRFFGTSGLIDFRGLCEYAYSLLSRFSVRGRRFPRVQRPQRRFLMISSVAAASRLLMFF